ncbi:MAG: hypothetical protein ACRDGJ_03925, partial [Candidatus Limnocylindria bacterium]
IQSACLQIHLSEELAMASTNPVENIAALLREAGSAHHLAFAATNGDDPDWPRWYAEYLATPLAELLGRPLTVSALEADLASADAEHRTRAPSADWSSYYAGWFLERNGGQ